jgi:hypothetical protein
MKLIKAKDYKDIFIVSITTSYKNFIVSLLLRLPQLSIEGKKRKSELLL